MRLRPSFLFFSCIVLFWSCNEATTSSTDATAPEGLPTVEVKEYKLPEVDKCQKPQTVRDLTSGMQKIFYQVNSDNAANLQLFGGTGISIGKKQMVVIVDFMQYKDLNCEEKTRYGVGVRLFLKIKKAHKRLDLNNLPHLAANVQLGRASVEYIFKTIGVTGNKINALMPRSNTNNFDVEGYANVINAVDQVQSLVRDNIDGVVIAPQQIPLN